LNVARLTVLTLTLALSLFLTACASGLQKVSACGSAPACPAGTACVSSTCVPIADAGAGGGGGAECQTDADCTTMASRCLMGACVNCLTESDCPVGTCSPGHSCVPLPDGCGTAEPLDLSQGPVHVSGSLLKAADDTRLSCATSTQGNDVVYALKVKAEGRLVVSVQTDGSFRPAVELRAQCTDALNPIQCSHASASQAAIAGLQVDPLAVGTYYLWLDSDDGAAGDFTLDVSLETPQPSDWCSGTTVYDIGDQPVVVTGSTVGLKDDTQGTCGGDGAPDAVFGIRTRTAVQLRFDLSTSTQGFSPLFYVRQVCAIDGPGEQVACLSGANTSFTLPTFGPGDLYLIVDGSSENALNSAGDFTMTITPSPAAAPPTNDKCGFAQQLALPPTGTGSVSVQSDTTSATDDSAGCGGAGAPDLVYSFHLDQPRLVQTTVTPLLGANYRPMVYLRPANACMSEQATDQIACTYAPDFGQSVTSLVPSLPAGDWFLWVDGVYSWGPFNLQVNTAEPPPPPANDSCAAPTALNVSSGAGTLTGTTLGGTEDLTAGRCSAPPGGSSPDVVFGISLQAGSFVGLDLKTAPGSTLLPVVELRGGGQGLQCTASMQANELDGCNWGDEAAPGRAVYTEPNLVGGAYWIWVEGDDGSQGDFSLRVVTENTPPAPANDNCQSVTVPLAPGMVASADTRNAMADAMDALLTGDPTQFGRDVVYTVVVSNNSTLTLTVTPDLTDGTLLRPIVALRTVCNDPSTTVASAAASDYGAIWSHTFTQLAPGTYYLWVGGVRQSSGAFTLQLQ